MLPDPEPGKSESRALRQVRESAAELFKQGKTADAVEFLYSALEAVLNKTQELELLIAKLKRSGQSPRSERLDPAQLSLLLEVLRSQGGEEVVVDPDAEAKEDAVLDREITVAESASPGQTDEPSRKREGGWRTERVERKAHRISLPLAEQVCKQCGRAMKAIGEDLTRRLEYVPGHFVEHEHHLEKYACGSCKEGVTTAPAPPQVLERSAADASLLAHVVVSKFADHTPLHRLSRIYGRSGAEIPVSTLSDWVAGIADLVAPLVDRLSERVMGAHIIRTDATGLRVLDPENPKNIQRGSIWALIGDDRDVVFRYTPTGEGATGPWEFLGGRKGYIQADASNVFDRLFNGQVASAIELGCWAHARRRFVALQDTDCRVAFPLKLIARLYRVEHLADAQRLSPEGRITLRRERSKSILGRLQHWLASTGVREPPSSDLAKAVTYCVNHWVPLTRFLEDGRVCLDNNLCESQLRDIALGRKNYLFAGSHAAAKRTARLYSLMRTCAQYRVPPLPYLTSVLSKLAAGWDMTRLDDLLPHRWEVPAVSPSQTD